MVQHSKHGRMFDTNVTAGLLEGVVLEGAGLGDDVESGWGLVGRVKQYVGGVNKGWQLGDKRGFRITWAE